MLAALAVWFVLNALRIATIACVLDQSLVGYKIMHGVVWPLLWGAIAGVWFLIVGRVQGDPSDGLRGARDK